MSSKIRRKNPLTFRQLATAWRRADERAEDLALDLALELASRFPAGLLADARDIAAFLDAQAEHRAAEKA